MTTPAGPDAGAGEFIRNRLRAPWVRLRDLLLGTTAASLVLAVVYLFRAAPRLLTWGEIVPPDESLVGALLPTLILLACSLVISVRTTHVPESIRVDRFGLVLQWSGSRETSPIPWRSVTIDPRGDRWEGTCLHVVGARGSASKWWVDSALAAHLRLAKPAIDAPVPREHPQR